MPKREVGSITAATPVPVEASGSASRAIAAPARQCIGFRSVLYEDGRDDPPESAPEYFRDLNLGQIVGAITSGKDEYHLEPFFHDSLKTISAILYRQEIMRDLEEPTTLECIKAFAGRMRLMREKIEQANKLHYNYQRERWFLHAVETYCAAVLELRAGLSRLRLAARGLLGFRDYVTEYAASSRFVALRTAVDHLTGELAKVQYCVLIKDAGFKVRKYDAEGNYSAEIEDTFRKFQQRAVKDYRVDFLATQDINHIEAKVLDFVALLYPETFAEVDSFRARNEDYLDPILRRFDREIQFYVCYLDYIGTFRRSGMQFCYPAFATADKAIFGEVGFDLALAARLVGEKSVVVRNDFYLQGAERAIVVSGPNQGGKTTFARTFGQLHHLGTIGCPVPGKDARLFLFDAMFTHFEREEHLENLHGKLQDDLIRMHGIVERATPRSIVIMNEIFTSTTLSDAVFLAREVMDRILDLDSLCVLVTFLDELASLSEKTVSMVSTVAPDNPALRTYRIVRRPADGRSYAISIAETYRVTYDGLKARIPD